MNRVRLLSLAGALIACAAPALAAPDITLTSAIDPGHLNGVWISARFNADRDAERTQTQVRPPQAMNKTPVLADWARKVMTDRLEAEKKGHPLPTSKALCLPAGTPQSMFPPAALPINILVTKDQVTILFEEFSYFRIIRMNQPHLKDPDPTFFGDSVGHWEGGTLVVDTIGISTKTTIGNDTNGAPHTEDLHVVERIHRTGDNLADDIVMTDPKAFTGPWEMHAALKAAPGMQLEEYYCVNDRNPPDASGRTGIVLPGS